MISRLHVNIQDERRSRVRLKQLSALDSRPRPLIRRRGHSEFDQTLKHATDEPAEPPLEDIDATLTRFNALLRLSEIEARAQPERLPLVSLPVLMERIREILGPMAEEHDVVLKCESRWVPPVCGDDQLLFEAIYNLVENAVKFSSSGHKVKVGTIVGSMGLTIVIRDSGRGIPASELPMLGKCFFRGRASEGTQGNGLG